MKAATGYSFAEFDALLPYFEQAHRRRIGDLKRRVCNVNSFSFATYQDYLFFVLYKIKTNQGYMVLGMQFGFSHATAEKLFKEGSGLLDFALKLSGSAPARKASDMDLDADQIYGLDATGFTDERPQDADKQRVRYSWKHRCPEQKATVMSDLEHAMIWFISPLHEGSVHDKTMFERDFQSDRSKLAGRKFFADLGYQGIKKFCPEGRFVLPFKKPKEEELTQDKKRYNRLVSSLRIRVEHAIRGLKRYGMLSERNRTKDLKAFDRLVGIAAGLWNFKCRLRLSVQMPPLANLAA